MGYDTRRGDKNKTKTTNPQKAVGTENWEWQVVGGWVGRKAVIQNCCEKTLRLSLNLFQDKSVAYSHASSSVALIHRSTINSSSLGIEESEYCGSERTIKVDQQ